MTCERVTMPDGAVAIVCSRDRRAAGQRCACGELAVALCDGRVPGVGRRTRRCDAPLCETHATVAWELGDDLHHCPACCEADRATRAVLLPREPGALVAYTDGSGTIATEPCGAGVAIYWQTSPIIEVSVPYEYGTNNSAELLAIRHALWATSAGQMRMRRVEIRTDSMYCITSLRAPYDPHPTACNAPLITAIRRRIEARGGVTFEHVRGHSGEPGNTRADQLAGRARRVQMEARRAQMEALDG